VLEEIISFNRILLKMKGETMATIVMEMGALQLARLKHYTLVLEIPANDSFVEME
jgi:hypothetical protein